MRRPSGTRAHLSGDNTYEKKGTGFVRVQRSVNRGLVRIHTLRFIELLTETENPREVLALEKE